MTNTVHDAIDKQDKKSFSVSQATQNMTKHQQQFNRSYVGKFRFQVMFINYLGYIKLISENTKP